MAINLVIMGPPGAGKGTQATALASSLGIPHLSTGDLLRKEIAAGTPIGVKTRSYMETGVLVPDKVMTELAAAHVLKAGHERGFVLDGYPRTVEQAQDMQNLLAKNAVPLSGVVNINLPDQVIIQRLVNRRTCPNCQRSYHTQANPPKVANVCDACGTTLGTRKDDTEDVIRHRIRVYWQQTAAVVEYYAARGLLRNVEGTQPIAAIAESLADLVGVHAKRSALA